MFCPEYSTLYLAHNCVSFYTHPLTPPHPTGAYTTIHTADIIVDKDAESYGPAYVTVLERPVESAASYSMDDDDGSREESVQNKLNRIKKKNLQRKDSKEPRPVSHLIKDHASSLSVRIQNDAVVDICIRATSASRTNPMMFSLRVEQLGDELTDKEREEEGEDGGGSKGSKSKTDEMYLQQNNNHEHHWTFLETQMDKIEHEMHTLIREADFFKDRDSIYHQQTDALHQATTFWPILHIFILLVTGFTQGTKQNKRQCTIFFRFLSLGC